MNQVMVGIVNNIALLTVLSLMTNYLELKHKREVLKYQIMDGFLLTLIGVGIMYTSVEIAPGIYFDTRTILLMVAGLFSGMMAVVITTIALCLFRLFLGGDGILLGCAVIVFSAILGMVMRKYRYSKLFISNVRSAVELYLFGLGSHLVVVVGIVLFTPVVNDQFFVSVILPCLLIYPIGIVLLGESVLAGIMREETERKNRELFETLSIKNMTISRLITDSKDIIIVKDVAGRCMEMSTTFLSLFSLELSDVLGKRLDELALGQNKNAEIISKLAVLKDDGRKETFVIKDETDKDRHISILKSVLKNELGEKIGSMTVGRDITDLKKNETDLRIAREKAEEAKLIQSKFLANMSHEIRTPMNGILGMLDLTLMTELSEEQQENLTVAKKSTKALLRIIDDILDYTRLEANKYSILLEEMNIYDLINDIYELFRIPAEQKKLTLKMVMDPMVPPILKADSARLRQVISNLIGNAIKFTYEGEVTLRVQLTGQKGKKASLLFEVIDTGIGISKKDMDKLFSRFTQLDDSLSKEFGGTGLGLAISKLLVELMGGKLEVKSEFGQGSRFLFTLKLESLEGDAWKGVKEVNRYLPEMGEKRNILIVEDDMVSRKFLNAFLTKANYQTFLAESGEKALELFQKEKVDMILMDISMPVMDGYETTRLIRELEIDSSKRVPIIAQTAFALKGDEEHCLSRGMDDYISKPIEIHELLGKINKWM